MATKNLGLRFLLTGSSILFNCTSISRRSPSITWKVLTSFSERKMHNLQTAPVAASSRACSCPRQLLHLSHEAFTSRALARLCASCLQFCQWLVVSKDRSSPHQIQRVRLIALRTTGRHGRVFHCISTSSSRTRRVKTKIHSE
jgi:hypothetical protein